MQRVRGVKHNFQQYFSNVVAVSFIGGGTHRHLFLVKKNIPRYPIIVSRSQVLVAPFFFLRLFYCQPSICLLSCKLVNMITNEIGEHSYTIKQ